MKIHRVVPLTRTKNTTISASRDSEKISTGPPDRRFNLIDQKKCGFEARCEGRRIAASVRETTIEPQRRGRWWRPLLYWFVAFATIAAPVPAASQGSKLVGTGAIGPSEQGWSVALSADGETAILGGIVDNKLMGAAWVFTHNNDVWTQQGGKLVGTGVVGHAGQGISVALSADGNTALVGGPYDNSYIGAAWVFTRGGGVWTQQGSKLIGAGAVGNAAQGAAVALSADGNTVIVGGPADDSYAGAAWIFTRSDGVWKQIGSKLIGSGAVGKTGQGFSVALSADGNTAIVGGPGDNANIGAAWVYSRSGATWSQQGSKLVGSRAVGESKQGHCVALSADGNTAIVGGLGDSSYSGAAWAFSRSGATWSQQGDKLVGFGAIGHAEQGFSAALSADGNTAVVGGIADDRVTGAAWVHNRRGGTWTQGPFLGF